MTISPKSMRAAVKQLLVWLGSRMWFRPFGMALVNRLNRGSFRLLGATPGVLDVYVRGSYARGNFVPLASDIDLALVLADEAGRSHEHVMSIHHAMHKARRRNPSIRDWWHHMIIASELPVVGTYSELYGSHEWRDAKGRASAPRSGWSDERLRLAAAWSQLCLWSGSAFHAFFHPQGRVHNFEAGVIKALRFGVRMGAIVPAQVPPGAAPGHHGSGAARTAGNSAPPDCITRLVEVYRSIERGAALIRGNAGLSVASGLPPAPGANPIYDMIETERARFIVLEDGLTRYELRECLGAIARHELPAAAATYVLPAAALRVWPFPAGTIRCGTPPPRMPLNLAREIYLFEALFLPSALRLAVAFPDAKPRLRRVVRSIRRAHELYGASAADLSREPDEDGARALFHLGSSLCAELQNSLLAFAAGRRAGQREGRANSSAEASGETAGEVLARRA